ncbi:hypothetical protein HYPSUDRAFT_999469 [Hypholoma sublateritium FD-334 SS-4]|uniref:DUF7598 domain-containing protein n=1 Tax=Hypholoma sublateritium (strain FD-334 SS-4) TaxID=945553 RepID=A0A0D2NMD9_HYPSF|nr:hypothetical protein HYPSUDRAFT_999469 [Hypholoma sublateritium FD-334 SS-4]
MLPPRAYTFIGLNGIRVLSVIALLLVFSSNVVTLANDIKAVNRFMAGEKQAGGTTNSTISAVYDTDYIMGSTVPNQPAGAFWAVLNRLFIIFQTILLILSEFGFPAVFFDLYFPVLGKSFGLGALGLIQMLIGAAVLSHHVDTFTLVSAFFLFSVGCVNTLAGLIFRESAKSRRSLTSWREHAKGALPTHVAGVKIPPFSPMSSPPPFVSNLYTGMTNSSRATDEETKDEKKFAGFGFGRQGEKAAALKGYLISKPVESLPRYVPNTSAL